VKRILGLLVGVPLLFAACHDYPAARMIGASLTEDGDPALYFVLCREESGIDSIDRVTLIDVEGTDPYDGDDEIVWRINRVGGNLEPLATEERSMVVAVTTGQIPNGYSVKERLDAPVASYGYVVAVGVLRPSGISIAIHSSVRNVGRVPAACGAEDGCKPPAGDAPAAAGGGLTLVKRIITACLRRTPRNLSASAGAAVS
jgi:hypothetical protein